MVLQGSIIRSGGKLRAPSLILYLSGTQYSMIHNDCVIKNMLVVGRFLFYSPLLLLCYCCKFSGRIIQLRPSEEKHSGKLGTRSEGAVSGGCKWQSTEGGCKLEKQG